MKSWCISLIDCGPTTTDCAHAFRAGSRVHLHIDQVDPSCGTMTFESRVYDGSGGVSTAPLDISYFATDMDITVRCE